MADRTTTDSSRAITRGCGSGDAHDREAIPCLSPAEIAMVLSRADRVPQGDVASLCLEALWRLFSYLSAPVATGLDYAPFALSASESASLAFLALQGTMDMIRRLGDRGTLSDETTQSLASAITEALEELAERAHARAGS